MRRGAAYTFAAISAAALLLLAGCSEKEISASAPEYPSTFIPDRVVVIDDEPGLAVQDITEESMALVSLGGREIEPGDILVGTAMGGFIRHVKWTEKDGSLLRVRTRGRTLGSAVYKGYTGGRFPIGPGSAVFQGSGAVPAGPGISLDGIVLYEDDSSSVTVERGYISFDPAVDVGLAMYAGRVSRLEVSLDGEIETDLEVIADLPVEISHEGTVRVASLTQAASMRIGRVPVPLSLSLDIFIDCEIEGSTEGPAGAVLTGRHDAGAGIAWHGAWERKNPGDSEAGFENPALSAEYLSDFSITVTLRTELRVSFFSSDTALIRLEPRISGSCDAGEAPVWRWSVGGSLIHSGSFEPGILDGYLVPFSAPPLVSGMMTDSGPYESDSHILVREWSAAGPAGVLERPVGIAAGADGSVFVTDQGSHSVIVFGPLGEYSNHWGSFGSSPGMFAFPSGIDVAYDGTVLVSDSGNHRVQRFTAGGAYLGEWGGEGTGDGLFVQPEGLAAGPDSLMAICDSGTSAFSIFTLDGRFVGRYPSLLARAAAFGAASVIYTSGCGSGGIALTAIDGQPLGVIGPDLCVTDLALDPDGSIYALDYAADRVDILDPSGAVISHIGSTGSEPGHFDRPGGLAVTPEGFVYVADTANGRVQLFAPK